MPSSSSSPPPSHLPPCDLYNLHLMKDGSACRAPWSQVRDVLHPAQQAVGYAAVQRKVHKDYRSAKKAQKRMNEPGSLLPFVLGPGNTPFLVDSHHTASALEVSGFGDQVQVTLQKICDWTFLDHAGFVDNMKRSNFLMGLGRPVGKVNELPLPMHDADAIPATVPQLQDDPWRSLAALVRKVKDEDRCPEGQDKCLRGYWRNCRPDDTMTPFFEFRWAYFFNQAYLKGCGSSSSLWDEKSDCQAFRSAYEALGDDRKDWQQAARLLLPLCRGTSAQTYVLPSSLGPPMGGEPLPGVVKGLNTPILQDDPTCAAPKCPKLPKPQDIQPQKQQQQQQQTPTPTPTPVPSAAATTISDSNTSAMATSSSIQTARP